MTTSSKKIVSSPQAVLSSIGTDRYVYRWFSFLITHHDVKASLSAEENIKKLYEDLKKSTALQGLVLATIFCGLCLSVLIDQYIYIVIAALLIYPYMATRSKNKKQVIKISEHMLFKDYERSDMCEKTLYQIGEEYSSKYGIPSLVDAISGIDSTLQRVLLAAALLFFYLPSINHWQFVVFCVCAYYFIYALLNTSVIYRRLKRP